MALSRLSAGDWEQFERLASSFMASEYPSLRTMATCSGDGGRDSELFSDDGEPNTAMQYSVTSDWQRKIKQTVSRLKETFPRITNLIYVTNQSIGASSDSLRKELRGNGLFLDIRDRSWFLERANIDRNREEAAESLARKFVDPLLSSGAVEKNLVVGLDSDEAKTALLFLEMQVQDTNRSLGLTKASYDTLTLAALRDTNTANRLTREAIYARVRSFLPSHSAAQIQMKVDASLKRLEQNSIRRRADNDEYHLLDSEIFRVSNAVSRIDALRREFEADLLSVIESTSDVTLVDERLFLDSARRVLEAYFLRKGEDFAQAAIKSEPHKVDEITLKDSAIEVSRNNIGIKGRSSVEILLSSINTLLSTPSEATSSYLRLLLESYTLFAFLAATPDVQKATRGMFGKGEIWLDTSVILPLLAETVMAEGKRPFSEMFQQARKAGILLFVTDGVIEEVERHINRSKAYARSTSWNGNVPFLYSSYVMTGKSKGGFTNWTETFVGEYDPIQDISEYLHQYHGIILESASSHENVSNELANAVQTAWENVHINRRPEGDPVQLQRLAAHDSEVYLHILSSRIDQRGKAPLGYTNWWLTLDSRARVIIDEIDSEIRPNINIGPVLSIDYLIRYLAFGPCRDRVDLRGAALAKVYADTIVETIPPELMALMEELRKKQADLPENVIQRRIRDTLNRERSGGSAIGSSGTIHPADLLDTVY